MKKLNSCISQSLYEYIMGKKWKSLSDLNKELGCLVLIALESGYFITSTDKGFYFIHQENRVKSK